MSAKKNRTKNFKKNSTRLLSLIKPHYKLLLSGLLGLVLGTGINLFFPAFIRKILNNETSLNLSSDLGLITAILIFLFAIQALFFYIRDYYFKIIGLKIINDLRLNLYQAIVEQDIAFFDRSRVGDLLSSISNDTQQVQRALSINISVALRYLLQVVGGIVLMIVISPKLTMLILLVILIICISSFFWGKKLQKLSRKMQDLLAESNVIAEESISAIRTVKIFAGIKYELEHFGKSLIKFLEVGKDRTSTAAAFSSTMVFFLYSAIAFVVYYGAKLVLSNDLTIGDFSAFILYCGIVAVSFGFLINTWDEFLNALGASERIYELIDLKPEIFSPISNAVIIPKGSPITLNFNNVSFSYPTRKENAVLENISFKIPQGKTLALVGPSGSGKSTIASLICRFYDPTAGNILVNAWPLDSLDLNEYYQSLAVVAQQVQIFSLSIKENICYGSQRISEEELILACKSANIYDFILGLPEKFETKVGDKGIQLSGGERQRVAIARAILKNPSLLILDEATSALDSQNEMLIQQSLEILKKNRTTLIIAHRLSTVQNADQVLVLKEGKIIQQGTHLSLIKEEGLYKTLVEQQELLQQ